MRTIIIRIGSRVPGPIDGHLGSYPVALYGDDGRADWRTVPLAVSTIPEDLGGLAQAASPASTAGGQTGAGVRDLYPIAIEGGVAGRPPIGQVLFGLAIRAALVAQWDRMIQLFPKQLEATEGRRVVLEIEPEEVRRLPWERMSRHPVWLARDPRNTLVRGPIDFDRPAARCEGPIKILIVVGSEPGDERVQAEEEIRGLERIFWQVQPQVEYRILEQPKRFGIQQAYDAFKPHVFHFIGHGMIRPDGESCLLLYNPEHGGDGNLAWRIEDIRNDLGGHRPAFAFLNACHSTEVAKRGGVWSIADLFLEMGASAVLGMQGAIRGTTAAYLAGVLYQALAGRGDIDLALTEARLEIHAQNGDDSWDWALPYLRVAALPEKVLPVARVVPAWWREQVKAMRKFSENSFFVDRTDQRENLFELVRPDPNLAGNALLVRGEGKIGKSHLICYCSEACTLWGRHIKYVELNGTRALDIPGVLQLICEGDEGDLIGGPLPSRAFRRFNRELNALLDGQDLRKAGVAERYPEDRVAWRSLPTDGLEDQLKLLFDGFLVALREVPRAAREDRACEFARRALEQAQSALSSLQAVDARLMLALEGLMEALRAVPDPDLESTRVDRAGELARIGQDLAGRAGGGPPFGPPLDEVLAILAEPSKRGRGDRAGPLARGAVTATREALKATRLAIRARGADLETERLISDAEQVGLAADEALADPRPLILVLDQITSKGQGGIHPNLFKSVLLPRLVEPFTRRSVPDVLLVLVVTDEEAGLLGIDELKRVPPTISLPRLRPDDFRWMAEEYFRRRDADTFFRNRGKRPDIWKKPVADWAEYLAEMGREWSPGEEIEVLYRRVVK